MRKWIAFLFLLVGLPALAEDLGFRFDPQLSVCRRGDETGFNPGYYGQCGAFDGVQNVFSGLIHASKDYSGIQLPYLVAEGLRFSSMTLEGANFRGASLRRADWGVVKATRSVLESVDFANCNMNRVDFKDSNLSRANFRSCYLYSMSFLRADLSDVDFSSVSFYAAPVLQEADIRGANFKGTVWGSSVDLCYVFNRAKYNDATILPDNWFSHSSKNPEDCMVKTP